MQTKNIADIRQEIIDQALELAVARGWENLRMVDLAQAQQISEGELSLYFEDKADILSAFGRRIDRSVREAVGDEVDEALSPRDRLFDVLMERYEVLNEYREGVSTILNGMKCDPTQLAIALPYLGASMARMLDLAGLKSTGWRGAIQITALTGVYVRALKIWLEDDSPDLGKTMAALDKDLGRIERVAELFGL